MDAYLALVQQERSAVLHSVLARTDECLQRLARRLPGPLASRLASDTTGAQHEAWRALAASLQADIHEQPAMLQGGQLHGFQMQGLRWMVGLIDAQLNGILAVRWPARLSLTMQFNQDEMGLGKTVQVLALLCYLKQVRQEARPSLVLVPASVLPNWEAEAARWAPDLRVLTYWGTAKHREEKLRRQVCTVLCMHSPSPLVPAAAGAL